MNGLLAVIKDLERVDINHIDIIVLNVHIDRDVIVLHNINEHQYIFSICSRKFLPF